MNGVATQPLKRLLVICLVGGACFTKGYIVHAEQRRQAAPHARAEAERRRTSASDAVLPGNTSSWRPYTNPQVLVTLGMNKAEVLLKAGRPALEDVISQGTDGHLTQTVWTYVQAGHNASVATLTFQGNKLARIDIKLHP